MELVFDRGTLLLRGPPSALAELEQFEVLWDARVGAFRAPAHAYGELCRYLDRSGIPYRDRLAPAPRPRFDVTAAPLRSYQRDALLAWEAAGRRGIVVLPTGSGKTRVALEAMARAGLSALVLVPTRVLLAQWLEQLSVAVRGEVGVCGDGERSVRPVTVCTFESAFRRMDDFGDRFGLLVIDEVHHFGAGGRSEALEMSVASARLGLTATPPEDPGPLERLVGPVVFRRGIADLAGSHLAPFTHRRTFVRLTAPEQEAYAASYGPFLNMCRRLRRSDPGAGWTELVRAAAMSAAGRRAMEGFHAARRIVSTAAEKVQTLRGLLADLREDRVFVFTGDNAAAYGVSRALLVPAITCDIGRAERAEVLEHLRDGRLRAVVSARVLNEGIDLPEARVGIILGGALGAREQVQRVGRLLRPKPGKSAVVHEVVVRDTFETRLSLRREQWLAG